MTIFLSAAALAALAAGVAYLRHYRRSTKEVAFVRTGLGGCSIALGGAGMFAFPVIHVMIAVLMAPFRLAVSRTHENAPIAPDGTRTALSVEMRIRVQPSREGVYRAACTLGPGAGSVKSLLDAAECGFDKAFAAVAADFTSNGEPDLFVQALRTALADAFWENGFTMDTASFDYGCSKT